MQPERRVHVGWQTGTRVEPPGGVASNEARGMALLLRDKMRPGSPRAPARVRIARSAGQAAAEVGLSLAGVSVVLILEPPSRVYPEAP